MTPAVMSPMGTCNVAVSLPPRNAATKAICEISCTPCPTGCTFVCTTSDKQACQSLQALCLELCQETCSVQCCCNDECCCDCRFVGCVSKCTMTANGVCITLSGCDAACVERTQAMCEMISSCLACGCECTLCLGTTTICCTSCQN